MLLDFYGFYPWGLQNTQYCEASYKIEMHFQNTTIFIFFFSWAGLLLIMVQTNTTAHVPTGHNRVSDTSMLFAKITLKLKWF